MLRNLRDEKNHSALGGRSTTASNSPMPGDYLAAADEGEGCGMCNATSSSDMAERRKINLEQIGKLCITESF